MLRGAQYNGNARFDTWLFTIARNLLIDLRRKRTMAFPLLDEMCEAAGDERPFEVASDTPNPFDRYQTQEDGQRVAGGAAFTLDPLHREVLVLRFHERPCTLEEIATVTRAPLSTVVKSRLYRGLAALKPRVVAASACRRMHSIGEPAAL